MKKVVYADYNDDILRREEDARLEPPDYDEPYDHEDEVDYVDVYIPHDTITFDEDGEGHFGSEDDLGWPKWLQNEKDYELEEHSDDLEVDPEDLIDYIIKVIVLAIEDKYGDDADINKTYDISHLDIEVEYDIENIFEWPAESPEDAPEVNYSDATTSLVENINSDKLTVLDAIKPLS